MSTADSNPLAFMQFSELPPELRHLIWRYTLPNKIAPIMFQFKRRCWLPGPGTAEPRPTDPNLYRGPRVDFRFRDYLLDDFQYKTPLYFVNHEARSIVMQWAHEQGLQLQDPKGRQQRPIFVRRFDRSQDILYVRAEEYTDFRREVNELHLYIKTENVTYTFIWETAPCLFALPEQVLANDHMCLEKFPGSQHRMRGLLILVNDKSTLPPADPACQKQLGVWECEPVGDWEYVWDKNRASFEARGTRLDCYESRYRLVEKAADTDQRPIWPDGFAIKLAIAVRR